MQITFHRLENGNLPLLHQWFVQPHVAYWWQEPQEWHDFYAKWSARITTSSSAYHTPWFGHIIQIGAIPIGYIQHFCVIPDRLYGYPLSPATTAGLDCFIGEPTYLGKKFSVPIITQYVELIAHQQTPRLNTILIEPAITNQRAIHVYTKAGFKALDNQVANGDTILLMYKNI